MRDRASDNAKHRAKYEWRKANRLCTQCESPLEPERQQKQCEMCAEDRARWTRNWQKTKKGRKQRRAANKRDTLSGNHRRWEKARRLEKKIAGLCADCSEPALEDSAYCHTHREYHRAADADYRRRRAEAKRSGVPFQPKKPKMPRRLGSGRPKREKAPVIEVEFKTSTPVQDYLRGDLALAPAVLRYIELCNGVTSFDIAEAFGIEYGTPERNNLDVALSRFARTGKVTTEPGDVGRTYYPIREQRRAA